jgi:hypothetical protein
VQTVRGAAGWVQDQDVDQTADFVDAQPGRVWLSVVFEGVGGADREDGESGQGQGGEAVPGLPLADLVLVETDLAFRGLESFFSAPPVMYLNRVLLCRLR